jgi:uncharacterized protein
MKYLVVTLVIVVVLWLLLGRGRRTPGARRRAAAPEPTPTFVACAHCGVHLPAADAVTDGALRYCSDAHRLAGPREPDRR